MLGSVKDWCLPILVDMVWITSCLVQKFHSVFVTFPRRVEERGLPVAINMVGFAPILKEKVYELVSTISTHVE